MAYANKEDKAAHSRAYYYANVVKRRQQNAEGYLREVANQPEALLVRSARSRAKLRGVSCTITKEHIRIPDVCPVLGIPLVKASGNASDISPTIDRVIPALGYVPGNVRVISYRANRLKCDSTLEEMELVLADLRKIHKG
jgi:hypothetical protein